MPVVIRELLPNRSFGMTAAHIAFIAPRRVSRSGFAFFLWAPRFVSEIASLVSANRSVLGVESDSASLLSPGVPLLSRSFTGDVSARRGHVN